MAHLIQLKTPPINHHLKDKWSCLYPNAVFGSEHLSLKEELDNLLTNFSLKRRQSLQDFYANKDILLAKAFERGQKNHQARLLASLVVTSILWDRNSNIEANTIFFLAQKICTNIIGKHKENKNKSKIILSIKEKIYHFFNIKVLVPETCFLKIKRHACDELLNPENPYFVPAGSEEELKIIINNGKQKKIYKIKNVDGYSLYCRTLKEMAKIDKT